MLINGSKQRLNIPEVGGLIGHNGWQHNRGPVFRHVLSLVMTCSSPSKRLRAAMFRCRQFDLSLSDSKNRQLKGERHEWKACIRYGWHGGYRNVNLSKAGSRRLYGH